MPHTSVSVRPLEPGDVDRLVDLSLRAWAPVFPSIDAGLGDDLARLLTPDWDAAQEQSVRDQCARDDAEVWVAVADDQLAGFVVVAVHDAEAALGAIDMVAVDPDHQRRGVGRALTDHGLAVLRGWGMAAAMVETGGDPGHAPARALYEAAGFTHLPIARYFTAL